MISFKRLMRDLQRYGKPCTFRLTKSELKQRQSSPRSLSQTSRVYLLPKHYSKKILRHAYKDAQQGFIKLPQEQAGVGNTG